MKPLFRVLGAVVAISLILVFATFSFNFVKKVWFGKSTDRDVHVSVVDLSGVITNSLSFTRSLQEQVDNKSTKAIVVRINSPGGLVGPSQEMYEAIRKADEKIPVLISMGPLAASGGYYAALGGRKIYANAGTLTASIGVIMEMANTEKLYTWAKIERFTLKAGKFKDVGTPLRAMKPEEKELLQSMLTDIHEQFRATVKERRKLTDAEIENTADGRVMTGNQAKKAKLVDELGGLEDALREAKSLAKIPADAHVHYPVKNDGILKRYIFGDDEDAESRWGAWGKAISGIVSTEITPPWRVLLLAPVQ